VHSVIETPSFLADAKEAGMGEDERAQLVIFLSVHPKAGDVMPGTGGARKIRFKRQRTGKRGGYRIIFYYAGEEVPVFLLNVFVKGDRANLSKSEQNTLRIMLARIAETTRRGF